MPDGLPTSANIVIVGAGAVGVAIAWQLAERGVQDVVVLEKAQITHGSTWHAAGLVGQFRTREDLSHLMRSSVALIADIERETPIDWRPVGSLRIASSPERLGELVAGPEMARRYGIEYHLIDAAEALRRFPLLSLEGITGAAWVPGDGYVDSSSLTLAMAARPCAARVRPWRGVEITGFEHASGHISAIAHAGGTIGCKRVVLAAGVWARALGRMLGLNLAAAALEHQYAVTEKHASVPRDLPALRDPDLKFYVKPDVGALAIGGWEDRTPNVHGSLMPASFGRTLLRADLDRMTPWLKAACRRIPLLGEVGIKTVINGPIPVSPDGEPILGPAPGFDNLHLAIAFTSGIAASAGAGRAMAEWIVDGKPVFALPSLAPERFDMHMGDADLYRAAERAYATYYALSRPSAAAAR
jgi:sarcosine dehydrogenase